MGCIVSENNQQRFFFFVKGAPEKLGELIK
jgi:magnesium-transporting ATPase (P-type)